MQIVEKVHKTKFSKFMAMVRKITINVPLVKALEQMPDYAKFMKNLVTKKKTVSYEPMDNLHHYSTITTRSLV